METLRLSVNITRSDYITFYYLTSSPFTKLVRLAACALSAVIGAVLVYGVMTGEDDVLQYGALVLCALSLGFELLSPFYYRRKAGKDVDRAYRAGEIADSRRIYTVDSEGIRVENEGEVNYLLWGQMRVVKEDRDAFLLYFLNSDKGLYIPKNLLDVRTEASLRLNFPREKIRAYP